MHLQVRNTVAKKWGLILKKGGWYDTSRAPSKSSTVLLFFKDNLSYSCTCNYYYYFFFAKQFFWTILTAINFTATGAWHTQFLTPDAYQYGYLLWGDKIGYAECKMYAERYMRTWIKRKLTQSYIAGYKLFAIHQ